MEYHVVSADLGSPFARDFEKGAEVLAERVNALIAEGWTPLGGIASVEAGGGIFLLQAMVREAA